MNNNQPPYNNGQNNNQYNGYNQPPYGGNRFNPDVYFGQNDMFAEGPTGKSRGVAALLAIFLGSIGIQYFYLGKTTPGIIFLIGGLLSCGSITGLLSLIQGIMMLCMSNYDFTNKYANTPNSFPLF